MPRGDGTGPRGEGPGTGRGMGGCGGGRGQGRGMGQRSSGGRKNISVNWEPAQVNRKDEAMNETGKKAVVNEEECIGCSACITACPNDAISVDDKAKIDMDKCTGCGECISICPVDAIKLQ